MLTFLPIDSVKLLPMAGFHRDTFSLKEAPDLALCPELPAVRILGVLVPWQHVRSCVPTQPKPEPAPKVIAKKK